MSPISFHSSVDTLLPSFQRYFPQPISDPLKPFWRTYRDITLAYRFYPHFHPYVLPLAEALTDGGAPALQALNTQYISNPDQTLQTIPNSTRAVLNAAINTTDSQGTAVTLLSGTPLTLPDGTVLVLPAGTVMTVNGSTCTLSANANITLPGVIPANGSSTSCQVQLPANTVITAGGTNTTLSTATPAILADQTTASLNADTSVTLSDGTSVKLTAGTGIRLRNGLPLPTLFDGSFFNGKYQPNTGFVDQPFPVQDLDFSISGAYAIYNWELFFHTRLLISIHLSQNGKYQAAQDSFHCIFDPTDDSEGPTPARYWKVRPFQYTDAEMITKILTNLSTGADPQLQQDTNNSIQAWRQAPFQPWVVAQYRPTSMMLKTVMAYLDNLIAWGDSLFQQYTIETINEATQLYVLAANILGPKPQQLPVNESVTPQTYASMRGKLSSFSDALVDMEVDLPFDITPAPSTEADPAPASILNSIGKSLFFCVPQNDMLLGYWDTVADRLFKIHNSLNIQGVFQPLPLFDPPIDPALLVRAAAAGLEVNAIVSGLNQPLPLVRFQLLVSKAAEICQEVKSLGANLLSALEKQDNEALSLLRAQHESTLLNLAESVKYSQWQDAIKTQQALEQSLNNAIQRYTYYQKLLGRTDAQISSALPQMSDLDTAGLQSLNFSQSDDSSEPALNFDSIPVNISANSPSVDEGEIKTLSDHEVQELDLIGQAETASEIASASGTLAAAVGAIPQFYVHSQPMGVGATMSQGGMELTAVLNAVADASRGIADERNSEATQTAKAGSYQRRAQEWLDQSNLAEGEINQTFKQLRGSQIRVAIAEQEYKNHQKQMDQAAQIASFLQGQQIQDSPYVKESTVQFYVWMKGQLRSLYTNAFQLAFSVAKKAEVALQHELGDPGLSYIQYNYQDGMEGLLAGEKLLQDIKRMEMDYYDLNVREYEMTKHVSLLQVAPLALLQLMATGTCQVSLPEEIFDMDGPGHYFRRIKSVAITIPCVTGPYTGVNCNLTLQKSSIRTNPQLTGNSDPYASTGDDDTRFSAYSGIIQAVVTSSAQSDSGLFETNLHDERYLPFEYSGVISTWQLTLPSRFKQFDLNTITDVILHIRYTAREGGETLSKPALNHLAAQISSGQGPGSVRLFSMRHEFPMEWAKFKAATVSAITPAPLSLTMLPQHYPYWSQGLSTSIVRAEAFALPSSSAANPIKVFSKPDGSGTSDQMAVTSYGPLLDAALINSVASTQTPTGAWNLYFSDNSMSDLWLAVTWTGK